MPMTDSTDPIEPIPAEQARQRLAEHIVQTLGPTWDDPERGWSVISRTDYAARLTDGKRVLDFYVDLLGEVSLKERPATTEDRGRVIGAMLLAALLMLAVLVARASGFWP
jgi:hypothetical protein